MMTPTTNYTGTLAAAPSHSLGNSLQMSGPQRTALISSMAVMMLFSIFGNVTLISSIWRTPRLHTRTNYFIFNLACADLGVTLLCMPFSLVTCYMQRWIFGNVMCQINGFMNILFAATSLLTLTAISIEKYFSIVRAMDHAITTRRTKYMLLCTWIVPGLLAAIPLARFTSYELNPGSTQCSVKTPLRTPGQIIHATFMVAFAYFFPLCIITFSYISIFRIARKHARRLARLSVTSDSSGSLNFMSAQNQITITLFIMFVVFLICWSPYFVYLIHLATNDIEVSDESTKSLVLASYWLAFSNSVINPYIYGVRNPQVRSAARRLPSSLLRSCCDAVENRERQRQRDVRNKRQRKIATSPDAAMYDSTFCNVNEANMQLPVICEKGTVYATAVGSMNPAHINTVAHDEEDLAKLRNCELIIPLEKKHEGRQETNKIELVGPGKNS